MMWKNLSKQSIRNILAVIMVVGMQLLLYFLMVKKIPEGNKDTLNLAVGFLFAGVGGVMGYYFGASKSPEPSKKKDDEG